MMNKWGFGRSDLKKLRHFFVESVNGDSVTWTNVIRILEID